MPKTVTISWHIRDATNGSINAGEPLFSWEELLVERRTGVGAYATRVVAPYTAPVGTPPLVATQPTLYKYTYVDVDVPEGAYNYRLSCRNKNTAEVYYQSESPVVTVSGATEVTIGFDALTLQFGLRGAPPTCTVITLFESPGNYYNGGTTTEIEPRSYVNLCGSFYDASAGDPPLRGPFTSNYGLVFDGNWLLNQQNPDEGVDFGPNLPSSPMATVARVATGQIINRAAGLQSPFTVKHRRYSSQVTLQVYSEINGTGTLLNTVTTASGSTGLLFPLLTITWTGTAKSLKFTHGANTVAYDDFKFFLL